MKLSVIIPVYNERSTILEIIERVKAVDLDKEIIVVDDSSTDGTRELLESVKNIKLFSHPRNQGKGAAIGTGLKHATGDFIIPQDGDMEYDPQDYARLLSCAETNGVAAVYGSRFEGKGKFICLSFVANKALTFITNLFFSSRLTDMETCYKCMRRDVIRELDVKAKRFDFEPEITAKLLRAGHAITEVPISYKGRTKGKKIGARDFAQALFTLVKWRFTCPSKRTQQT
jgi:glycosyltransferase involved in cell wall biosynthesis